LQEKQNDPVSAIASRIKLERDSRSWSLSELAVQSGVSKAMISKVERGEASPTAAVLGRLSGAFGLPLSALVALAERGEERLVSKPEQPAWTDPETGYTRRAISPRNAPLELVEVTLPPGVRVPYPASAFAFQHQQIWIFEGELHFQEGSVLHRMTAGDCLMLGPPADCIFFNASAQPARYLIALARR
jgi:transcriptional regulator with XRE-family HTH domain